MDDLVQHYDQLAEHYDVIHEFKCELLTDLAIQYLNIQPDDKIADIGGGTGGVADTMKKKCPHIKSDILVVDPSSASLKIAQEKEGLSVMLANIDEFLASPQCPEYNKYFIVCAHHHIPDQLKSFQVAYSRMPIGGTIVILHHLVDGRNAPPYPLWKAALDYRNQRLSKRVNTVECLEKAGFTVNCTEHTHTLKVEKEKYFFMVRHRFMTIFNIFNEAQIEEGIRELDETFCKGSNYIVWEHVTCAVQAIKK